MDQTMTNSPPQDTPESMQDTQDQQTPLDSIISRVDSYIQDPKLVTAQTLTDLKTELEDLKTYIEGEETQEPNGSGMDQTMSKIKGAQA